MLALLLMWKKVLGNPPMSVIEFSVPVSKIEALNVITIVRNLPSLRN